MQPDFDRVASDVLNVAWKRVRWVIECAAKDDDLTLKHIAEIVYLLGVWDGANLPDTDTAPK